MIRANLEIRPQLESDRPRSESNKEHQRLLSGEERMKVICTGD